MTYSEVILGSSPFIFSPQYGHRTRIKELEIKNQPENKAKNRRVDILVVEERESKTENKNNNVKNK